MKRKNHLIFIILFLCYLNSSGQPKGDFLEHTVAGLERYWTLKPLEKVYLHFDKPYYGYKDTVWFKAYLVVGSSHFPSGLSKVLYADLINERDSVIKTIKLPITAGIAQGDFVLNDSLKRGGYRVRAYTRWMENAGADYFFNRALTSHIQASPHRQPVSKQMAFAEKVIPKQSENSIQFFPEGGEHVNGLRSKIAFKAIDPQGFGIEVSGHIRDDENQIVAELNSQHLGMGVFAMVAQKARHYKAILKYADGSDSTADLPVAKDYGFVLSVNASLSDSIFVKVAVGDSFFQNKKNSKFYLIAQSGGTLYFTSQSELRAPVFTTSISRNRFPSGTVQFSLFSADGEPLSERVVFIQNSDLLSLTVKTDKDTYLPREKVEMELLAKNSNNEPVIGSFSVSVINESRVPADEASQTTILSHLLLTSELKGYVEQPNYYFTNPSDKTTSHLDLLMLTQGYRRFDWKLLKSPLPLLTFQPEKNLQISGLLSTPGGKAIPGGKVRLYNPAENLVLDTISDADGKFTFKDLEMAEDSRLVIQGRKAKDGKNVEISIIQGLRPAVNTSDNPILNARSYAQLHFPKEALSEIEEKDSVQRREELKQVTITAKRNVKPDQFNSYGSRQERLLDVNKMKDYPSVYDALVAKVVGFRPDTYRYANLNDLSGNAPTETQNVVLNGWVTGCSSLKSIYMNEVERLALIGSGSPYDPYFVRLDTKAYAGTDTATLLSEVKIKVSPVKKKQVVTNSANLNGSGNADQVIFADKLSECTNLSDCLMSKLAFCIKKNGLFYSARSYALTGGKGPPMVVIYNGLIMEGSFLDQINVRDVASIEVLRSVGRSSIYGSNAPGGALVITTKRGNEETYASTNQRHPGVLTYSFNGYYKAKQFYAPVYNTPESMIPQQTDFRSTIYWKPDVVTDSSGHAFFKFYNSDNKGIYKVVIEGINDDGNIGRSVYRYIVE